MISDTRAQRIKLRELLENAPIQKNHVGGEWGWVSVSWIMRLGIAQHGARISELRRELRREAASGAPALEIVNCLYHSDRIGGKCSDYALMPAVAAREWKRRNAGK